MKDTNEPEFESERAIAARLGIGLSTLQQARYAGQSPPYVKIGRAVRYRRADVDAWIAARTVRPQGGRP